MIGNLTKLEQRVTLSFRLLAICLLRSSLSLECKSINTLTSTATARAYRTIAQ